MMNTNVIISVECQCPFCGRLHEVQVNGQDYLDWQNGKLAQNAFPYLSPTEREELISEICPKCQNNILSGDDNPAEDDNQSCRFQLVYEDDDGFLAEVGNDFSDEDFLELISDL